MKVSRMKGRIGRSEKLTEIDGSW